MVPHTIPKFYWSSFLCHAETCYDATAKKCLAVPWAKLQYCACIENAQFVIRTDHSTPFRIPVFKRSTSCLARWRLRFWELHFKVVPFLVHIIKWQMQFPIFLEPTFWKRSRNWSRDGRWHSNLLHFKTYCIRVRNVSRKCSDPYGRLATAELGDAQQKDSFGQYVDKSTGINSPFTVDNQR